MFSSLLETHNSTSKTEYIHMVRITDFLSFLFLFNKVLIAFVLWASVLICGLTISMGAMLLYKIFPLFLKIVLRRMGIRKGNYNENIINIGAENVKK
jgi:hypothetical protein